ncbi:trypco2 family protein [Streptomyces sp. CA-288835]|uniref:trypco2 family protein n=1 Tax=Streptomyces sp. CA-288835 TaxID=3240069 RepID=UPI003D8BA746
MTQDQPDAVPLAAAISQLRKELQEAMADGEGQRLRFAVDSIEMDLQVAIDTTKKGNASLSLWRVLSLGGGLDHKHATTHRLTLRLSPTDTLNPNSQTLIGDGE